jgi:1-deoxy-D-xylulose-5-phosphate reductoisomerase
MASQIRLAIIGSTGSIGESTLKVVDRYPDRLRVVGLATGRNLRRLQQQRETYHPDIAAIAQPDSISSPGVKCGTSAICEVAAWPDADVVVIASVGFTGVRPTLAAITAGKKIALANKETLVAAGAVVVPAARHAGVPIAPIDSEHSAIWQCLRAGDKGEVKRIILTASGGPFRSRAVDTFDRITPAEALAHPTWKMGPRITVDSATMMNKGFEIIEAAWLFDIPPDRIDVVIHPQSLIHSMVEFQDGSVISQMGIPDMTIPITYAIFAPERLASTADVPTYEPSSKPVLEFYQPDSTRFPALDLARAAHGSGALGGAVLNAADEVAVAAFLEERLPFARIIPLVERVLNEHTTVRNPTIGDIEEADRWARVRADELVSATGSRVITS